MAVRKNGVKPRPMNYTVSVQEICNNTTGRNQYASTTANYTVPDSSMHTYKQGRYLTEWKKENGKKQTYIDKIFANGKRVDKSNPAPTAYSPDRIAVAMPRSFSQVMSKSKRISNIDKIMITERKRVAPNHYKTDAAYKEKLPGVYLG